MTEGCKEFLSNISQEKFWKYLGIKACLIRGSKDKRWRVAFIDIQLIDEPKVYENTLSHFKNLIFIQKILNFNALGGLLKQIIRGGQIKIANTNASLEWINGRPRYDFKMRAYAKQEFHIDNACHILIKSGEYPKGINKLIQNLEASLSKNNPPYRSLKDAVSSLLGIEFGTPAISPFVRLLAPVYVKIEESKAIIENLKILVSASLDAQLSKIRLEMFGEDENAKPTKLRENITIFTRDEDSELLKPIEISVGKESRYVKLNLHYRDELLEATTKLFHRFDIFALFITGVWASPDKVPFLFVPMNTVLKETNSPPPPPGTPGPFSMSDQNSLKNFYVTSGFIDPAIERMNVIFDFDSSDDFTTFSIEHGGPTLQKMLAGQTNERKEEIFKAISKAAEKYADNTTGKAKLENEAILIVGRK
jgi:hypothetical protein